MQRIYIDIGSPENMRLQSLLTHVARIHAERQLERSTAALEARLARRFGLGRRAWEASKVLGAAVTTSLLAVVAGLAQIGGAL